MAPVRLAAEDLLIITGSMGSGKTAVLAEASDILTLKGTPHASINLDGLATAHLPSGVEDNDLMYRNLRCVWENCARLGLTRLMLARAIEDRAELERCREAVSGTNIVICRLSATLETMRERVRNREVGMLQHSFVARVAELDAVLDQAHLENFSLMNENRPVTDVAREMLVRSGWL